MDTSLSFHPERNQRLFLFSRIPTKLEKSLMQKIESLHGKAVYPVRDTFTQSCTHVIAQEFSTTEKVLGALAGGKWLLSTKYILDSYTEGHWLKEEEYELTDLSNIAMYQRRERMLKGYGLYEGWKILILLEPQLYSRKFKRILSAGGAEIALKSDVSSIDFVLTKKEMLDHAQARVDSIIPLVDISYIMKTLLFRHDPADLKKFDMRHPQKFKTFSKAADSSPLIASKKACSSHHETKSSNRADGEGFPSKKKKICSQIKQTSLTQFMKPSVKKLSSSDSICDGRQSACEKKNLSINKYASESSHCDNTQSSVSGVYVVEDGDQNQDEKLKSNDINKIEQSKRKGFKDVMLVNTLASPSVVYKVKSDIQNQDALNSNDISEIQHTGKSTFKVITPVNALPVMEEVNGNIHNQYGVESNYGSKIQQTGKDTSEDVIPGSTSLGVTSMAINTNSVELKEFHICLGKKIPFAIDPKLKAKYLSAKCEISHSKQFEKTTEKLKRQSFKDIATPPESTENEPVIPKFLRFCRKWSNEHNSVSEQAQHHKKVVPPVYTATKQQIWKAIVQFLRTRNHLNEVCCTSTLSIPKGIENFPYDKNEPHTAEFDPQQVIYTPNLLHGSYECRELTSRELHFYTCCTDDDTVNEEELLVNGIENLLLQLSSYLYPPPNILGSLLKNFVLKTEFSIVHSRALRVAYMLLTLHPPVSAKMRTYYLSALQHAMKPDDFGSYIPWKFVWSVIQLASCMESDEDSWSDQNMEEEEALDKASRALHLLEFIVLLLTEDVRHSTYGEAVQDLLTWQIFCGSSKSCSVLTSPMKQLLHLWVSEQTTTPALHWHLSQLVSVVLEILWKFSGQPLFPVVILPASVAAVQKEIGISLKGWSSQKHLEVIRSLPTPWAQAVVTFIITQEISNCPNRISLSYIDVKKTNFDLENEGDDSKELLLTLASCYLEVSSYRYVTLIIRNHIGEILKNKSKENKEETGGVISVSHTENYCQKSENQKNKATKKQMPQYLNLVEEECLQDLNKLEESAVATMYNCIKQDKDIFRKWSKHKASLVMRKHVRYSFKTLCL